jgi:hypothetical protein
LENAIAISMDGRGAWRDNVFVERLWRSVKYEEVYLRAYDSVVEARASIGRYFDFYNRKRIRALTHARRTKPTSTPCRWKRQHEFRRRCAASLRSGYALPARRRTTATHVNNRQKIHLSEAKRCSDKASHLCHREPPPPHERHLTNRFRSRAAIRWQVNSGPDAKTAPMKLPKMRTLVANPFERS